MKFVILLLAARLAFAEGTDVRNGGDSFDNNLSDAKIEAIDRLVSASVDLVEQQNISDLAKRIFREKREEMLARLREMKPAPTTRKLMAMRDGKLKEVEGNTIWHNDGSSEVVLSKTLCNDYSTDRLAKLLLIEAGHRAHVGDEFYHELSDIAVAIFRASVVSSAAGPGVKMDATEAARRTDAELAGREIQVLRETKEMDDAMAALELREAFGEKRTSFVIPKVECSEDQCKALIYAPDTSGKRELTLRYFFKSKAMPIISALAYYGIRGQRDGENLKLIAHGIRCNGNACTVAPSVTGAWRGTVEAATYQGSSKGPVMYANTSAEFTQIGDWISGMLLNEDYLSLDLISGYVNSGNFQVTLSSELHATPCGYMASPLLKGNLQLDGNQRLTGSFTYQDQGCRVIYTLDLVRSEAKMPNWRGTIHEHGAAELGANILFDLNVSKDKLSGTWRDGFKGSGKILGWRDGAVYRTKLIANSFDRFTFCEDLRLAEIEGTLRFLNPDLLEGTFSAQSKTCSVKIDIDARRRSN